MDQPNPLGRLQATVRPFEEGENKRVDVVRPKPGVRFYAYIDDLDTEEGKGRGKRLHMLLFCMLADWFDQFRDDLKDMPSIDTIGQAAQACAVEVILRLDDLRQMKEFAEHDGEKFHLDFEKVHLSEGWWLEVRLSTVEESVCPVTVFPPADGSNDPATIGNTPNEVAGWLHSVARVRPPSRLAKLHRFSHVVP
jgi:hypothetical protein